MSISHPNMSQDKTQLNEELNVEHSKDLCWTPAVDSNYLEHLRSRVNQFALQHKSTSDGGAVKRMLALKSAAASLRQTRAKEIKQTHATVLDMVAMYLDVPYELVLDGILDSDHQVDLLSSLLSAGGKAALIFSYSLLPPPPLDCGREFLEDTEQFWRVVVTDGTSLPLEGKSAVVYRINTNIDLEPHKVFEELMFTSMDVGPDTNVVGVLENMLRLTAADQAQSASRWGQLLTTPSGPQVKKTFLNQLIAFQEFLSSTNEDLQGRMELNMPKNVLEHLNYHSKSESVPKKDFELEKNIDQILKNLFKKIQQVMDQSESVRAERDDVGPRAELEYWRSWLTKFTCMLDLLHSRSVQLALSAQHVQQWHALCDRLQVACNEAADNVKYLDDLSELSYALYTTPPPGLAQHLRSILYSIRIMFASSRYYNSTERATSLLVKITNQVVLSFREYLTDSSSRCLWSFPKRVVIDRIQVCLDVYRSYELSLSEIQKAMLENPKEKPFGCSAVNVFVRINSFCARLEKIRDALISYLHLAILHKSCFEGVEKLTSQLENIFHGLVIITNDPLNDRETDFDLGYRTFQKSIMQLEFDIDTFCDVMLTQCPNVTSALPILDRFYDLSLNFLCLDRKLLTQLMAFESEMSALRDRYNEEREHIVLPWALPPVAGRIAWVRHLLDKIEHPMDQFKRKVRVITHPRAQNVVRQYNSLCKVLLHYELELHHAWCQQLEIIDTLLEAPVLRRHEMLLKVNWYPYLDEIVCEADRMWKLGLSVPDKAAMVQVGYRDLLRMHDLLCNLTSRYNALRCRVPIIYLALLQPQLHNLDTALDSGLEEISWMSLEVPSFCESVLAKLADLECFLDELSDITTFRIDKPMSHVANIVLVKIERDRPLKVSQLLNLNAENRVGLVKELNTLITEAECATIEIVNSFVERFDVPATEEVKHRWLDEEELFHQLDIVSEGLVNDQFTIWRWEPPNEADLPRFHRDCMHLYATMFRRVVDALLVAILKSLEALRSCVMDQEGTGPLLDANLNLNIPDFTLDPSLDQMQTFILEQTKETLHLLSDLTVWGSREELATIRSYIDSDERSRPPRQHNNYFKLISEHKEVVGLVQSMQGAVLLFKPELAVCIQKYAAFSYLWESIPSEEVDKFLANDPKFYAIEEKLKTLITHSRNLESLPDHHDVACIRLNTNRDTPNICRACFSRIPFFNPQVRRHLFSQKDTKREQVDTSTTPPPWIPSNI